MSEYFGAGSHPLYASKALSFKGIYKIAAEEGMSVDVVSPGELYTALAAGFPAERVYFHGNNKTDNDIRYAVDSGIGYFVVDNSEELKF
jgi:diaminopimelate decarboxylase